MRNVRIKAFWYTNIIVLIRSFLFRTIVGNKDIRVVYPIKDTFSYFATNVIDVLYFEILYITNSK